MGADIVTLGPPVPNQIFGVQGIILDKVNNVLYTFGENHQLAALHATLQALGIQPALANVTTARPLLSQVFGAGALNVAGRTIRVSGSLIYSTTASNDATITLTVGLGGSGATITTAATNAAASTNLPINFSFTLTVAATGAAGSMVVLGSVNADIGTTDTAAIATYLAPTAGTSGPTDFLTAETLTLTIAASAALPSVQLLNAMVELVA
jgi:hypothetical protein